MKKSIWIPGLIILVGILAAVAVFVVVALTNQNREATFLEELRSNPRSHVESVSDEQLLVGLSDRCDRIAKGHTLDDELESARGNVAAGVLSSSPLSPSEYYDNVEAIYEAASKACGG
ncbi:MULTISPECIES: hypothetical protein [unclassified Microbacterium]|uniref:hypothetical protein n=1 Tax=unclassified Microbacterium TaxID=2609290 RepID=UPI00300F9227